MFEAIQSTEWLSGAGTGVAWAVTLSLMVAGLIGCFLPILPGHLILFIGAVAHRLMLGEAAGLKWWSFAILLVLMAISQTAEMVSGAAGSKWFGGTRWGAGGAIIGSIVGMFFLPFGLVLGPLVGAIAFEMFFAKSTSKPALKSGVGSVFGVLAGMGFKIVIGLMMILWFFADVFWIR